MHDVVRYAVERLDPRDIVAMAEVAVLDADTFPYPSARLQEPGVRVAWIARADVTARVIGFLAATRRAGEVYIQGLAVVAVERRRGVAAELLRRCVEAARRGGAQSVALHVGVANAGAVALYRAAGFVARGRVRDFYRPEVYSERDALWMVLPLAD